LSISIGLNPGPMTRREKLLYLWRLVPMIEANCNTIELAPRETGKTYLYRNQSYYVTVLSGVSLFVNSALPQCWCTVSWLLTCQDDPIEERDRKRVAPLGSPSEVSWTGEIRTRLGCSGGGKQLCGVSQLRHEVQISP